MAPPRELIALLRRHTDDVQAVALALRRAVLEEMAPCREYIYGMRHAVVLLYGPTAKVLEDCVCMINVYRHHVNLCFPQGTELNDGAGVLKGTGKRMRHISVKQLAEVERPEIRAFVEQARSHAGLTRPRRRNADDVITVFKTKRPKVPRAASW